MPLPPAFQYRSRTMRIWIDTDIGSDVDDALTLAYVLRHPGFELAGVSTVFGDVPLRTRIAQALLSTAEAPDVPVITGLGVPITPHRIGIMFGHEGAGLFEDPAPQIQTREEPDAEKKIEALAAALEKAKPDVVVAIGPLSNLGALARAGVRLPRLAIMGGKVEDVLLEGMIPQIPEWNWFCDPGAVQEVLAAEHETPPRIVPAEVTFRTALEPGDVDRLAGGDALAQQISTLCTHWLDFLRARAGGKEPRVALHDPLTAATLVEAGLCPFEERRIRVDDGAATTVETGVANVEVATDVDTAALRQHLMETWLSTTSQAAWQG